MQSFVTEIFAFFRKLYLKSQKAGFILNCYYFQLVITLGEVF